jgi:hypothetical protein
MIWLSGTIRYDTVLVPYFNRTVSDFLKNQHGTVQNMDTIRYDIKVRHDTK